MVAVLALSDWLSQTRSSLLAPEGVLASPGTPSHAHVLLLLVVAVVLFPLLLNLSSWVLWIFVSIVVGIGRFFYTVFVLLHVICDVWCLSAMKSCYSIYRFIRRYADHLIGQHALVINVQDGPTSRPRILTRIAPHPTSTFTFTAPSPSRAPRRGTGCCTHATWRST